MLKISYRFLILIPVLVLVAVPWLLLCYEPFEHLDLGGWRWLGVYLMPVGAMILVTAYRQVYAASQWRGELDPLGPPRELITHGIYRFVRNPMIDGVYLMLAGEALLFESMALFLWLGFVVAATLSWIVWVEERRLEKKFRGAYQEYKTITPRFFPRLF